MLDQSLKLEYSSNETLTFAVAETLAVGADRQASSTVDGEEHDA